MNLLYIRDNIVVKGKKSGKTIQEEIIVTCQEFAELIEREGRGIYTFCYHLTGKKDEADELYQETMLKAMGCLNRMEQAGNPKSFLMGIAVKCWKNKRRKYARRQYIVSEESLDQEKFGIELVGAEPSPEELYLSQELCGIVRKETAALKEKYRIPIYLYYSVEMSIEEIAATLHIPKGTVKSRLYVARMMIAKKLEEYGYEI